MPVIDRTDGPADDEAGEQIEDRRQIQLAALADHELGRVADPAPIRRVGRELPIEQIRRDRLVVIAHRRALEPFPGPGFQPVLLHQPNHPFAADALAAARAGPRECAGCRTAVCSPQTTRAPARAAADRAGRGPIRRRHQA